LCTGSVGSRQTPLFDGGGYFGTSAQFWINLQSHYDLEIEADSLGDALDAIHPLQSA
jgi:plasmid maintenance system antidote protein VapI